MSALDAAPQQTAQKRAGLAHHFESFFDRLTPLNAAIIALTGGFILLLFAYILNIGTRLYDPTISAGRGKEVGFLYAPNWFGVYLILFPPYVFLFGLIISISKSVFKEAASPQGRLVTGAAGSDFAADDILQKWVTHLKPLSVGLWVLLLGVVINTVLQWIDSCLGVYWRSANPQYQGNTDEILGGQVLDWSTYAYIFQNGPTKDATLAFSAAAYIYMAVALFIYLAILAYYAFLCWFVMRLASASADPTTRLIIRGNQPLRYFSELFNTIYAATVLGLGAAYCMRLQAQYLNSTEASIFAYAFSDLRCSMTWLSKGAIEECLPRSWENVSFAMRGREAASSFTSFAEAVYTIALFLMSAALLRRAFNSTRTYYLEKIGDPNWQKAVAIKYDAAFVEKIEKATFLSTIARNHVHLSLALLLIIATIIAPYLGTIFLLAMSYAALAVVHNAWRGVNLSPASESVYAESFSQTNISDDDRDEILLFLQFHHPSGDFGPSLSSAIDDANIPQSYKDHMKRQIKAKEGNDPARIVIEVSLNYEPLEGGTSTVLGEILRAMKERIGLDFGCFVAVKSRNCGLISSQEILRELSQACTDWRNATVD